MGYDIDYTAKLGLGSILVAKQIKISSNARIESFVMILDCNLVNLCSNSKIYRSVRISGLNFLNLGHQSLIGANCSITSRHRDRRLFKISNEQGGNLFIADNSVIGRNHTLDLLGNITIGENVVIGGCYSQLFTHGYDCYKNISYGNIKIGNNVYIGTNVIVLAGCKIVDEVVIAAGSVVCKSCNHKGVYGGNPIRFINENPTSKGFYIEK